MKTAVGENSIVIEASAAAPETAVCPYCDCPVTLRKRRSMDGKVTYFWRHLSGAPRSCPGRSSPVGRRKNK